MSSNLDDILNDALNDFDFEDTTKSSIKPVGVTEVSEGTKPTNSGSQTSEPTSSVPLPSVPGSDLGGDQGKWAEEFLSKLNVDDPEIKKLMEEMQNAFRSEASDSSGASSSSVPLPNMPDLDFESPEMKSQLEKLQKLLAEVENGDDSDETLDRILDSSGMAEMMQQLMSKDVLLEPFKEMDAQYTVWLKANTSVEEPELNRFRQQHEMVQKIIKAYEADGDSASEFVASLISEMQALGDPPQGILQSMMPDMKFDESGKPLL